MTIQTWHYSPNVIGDLLTLVVVSVHEDPLDQVVAVLITGDYHALARSSGYLVDALTVDEGDARTLRMSSRHNTQVTVHELGTTDLEALLHNLGSKLVDAVAVSVGENVVDDTALVRRRTMFAQVLDTPVSELAMSNQIDACNDFFNGRALIKRSKLLVASLGNEIVGTCLFLLNTVLENVLNHQAACFAQCDLMPHTAKSLVDLEHDLRWLPAPAQLKEFLPDMTSIAMDDCFWDTTKEFTNHVSFMGFRNRIKRLLDNMTTESIHAEGNNIALNTIGDRNDLIRCAVLEAALHQEVAEAVDHEWIRLVDNCINDLKLLFYSANLELLLEKDRSLLIIAANNLIDNVLPVAGNRLVE